MALELKDTDSFDGTIVDTESETVIADARTADVYELLIDDGSGGSPATHDIRVEIYSTAVDDYMLMDTVSGSGSTSPTVIDNARGQKVRVTVTNSSGADATFRISLETFKEI